MKGRSGILASTKALLLGGALLGATLAQNANAADVAVANPNANDSIWESHGIIDVGTNVFIEKPPSGFGRIPTDPFWLTPKTTDSNAKMDEYGKVPRGLFLDVLGIKAGTKDGRFAVDFWADNVGFDEQRYYLGIYEPGRQYFNIGWDQTPHLLSTSAKTVFGGVGSTRLTVDPTLRQNLENNVVNATLGPPNPANIAAGTLARRNIEGFINNAETNIELKTLREKFTAGYRNTMWDNWDFDVDYSHEHRTGTRPLGIGWGLGALNTAATAAPTFGANPRPSTGSVEIPQPLDDRTQNANASGEYVGTTPWGTRWNTSLKYSGSFFSNDNKSVDVDNPFCLHCNAISPTKLGDPAAGTPQFGPSLFRYGLYPDNNVNGVTWNTSVEVPLFKTRYTSNVQYMAFRQNDPFINDATNGLTFGNGGALTVQSPTGASPFINTGQLRPYPASSLNGSVNAFLTNNVLYSHLTSDLTNTARVRYYDRQDNTPILTFQNYAYADGGLSTATPLTREQHSYSKLNIEDDLKWQPNRAWAFGLGYFFERYKYENGEVDATNESGAKAFINWTPWSWLTAWSSVQYSQRRYDHWLGESTDPAANAMRQFFVQNRDQTKANLIVQLQLTNDIIISPNGGVRWIEYPTDAVLNGRLLPGSPPVLAPQLTNSLGTQYDRQWNIGADLGIRLSPQLRATLGWNYEEHYLYLQSCCGGSATSTTAATKVPFIVADVWSSQIVQRYNTFIASGLWNAIPGKLDILADYVIALSSEANNANGCSAGKTPCTGANFATDPNPVWPTEQNRFQRFNVVAKYYVDPSVVKQMGFVGNVTLKARYTWEHNNSDNWAINNFTPYSPSAADAGGADITNGGRSLFLAYNNPNYTAQIFAVSLAANW
jgi:putative beta-barrel porin MtrB/PioB